MKRRIRFTLLGIWALLALCITGCGVNHTTPEGVVESLIRGYVSGKEKKVKSCYASGDEDESLQEEITANLQYFAAQDAKEVKIRECEVLSQTDTYTYVYVIYNLVLEDDQEYPCVGTYMVQKDGKKYYVISPSAITTEMSEEAATAYAKFMTTDSYKKYEEEYNAFILKNPDYESQISDAVSNS